ncbi:ASCH domain-containing protein [Longispora sp. K20-0274]|uniref:ASCH domain-containing protein n=1 Tax=Longispora sp. K20-0274 TaxID=3088255 RepID=UPI00399A203C
MTHEELPTFELGFPGPLRDQLVAAVLSGAKTSTSGLVIDYETEGSPLPEPGERAVVIDSDARPVAVIETTEVRVIRVGDCDLQHALDEGEGFETVAEWRRDHEKFWHGDEMREALGDPGFLITDDTLMVAQRFRVITRL